MKHRGRESELYNSGNLKGSTMLELPLKQELKKQQQYMEIKAVFQFQTELRGVGRFKTQS
jgi:hypothetical protein